MGVRDMLQHGDAIRRNYPLLGRGRGLMLRLRPFVRQYFIEDDLEARPIEREIRVIVGERSEGRSGVLALGTRRDVRAIGHEWVEHSLSPGKIGEEELRVWIGRDSCEQPYLASRLNISGLSFVPLSPTAIAALNQGARLGGFAQNTGEGGISSHHLHGGDLVFQIGTGYFSCRNADGSFDPSRFVDQCAREKVRMIEIKLSQGAKPGVGGRLDPWLVTPDVARARGIAVGQGISWPAWHSAFTTPIELMEFVHRLRELSGGKPVGIKLSVGSRVSLLAMLRASLETGIAPDFLTVDGGEGGTGGAPLEFCNWVGTPALEAWRTAHNALVGTGLRDRVRLIASGRIFTGFDMVRAIALGADACASGRLFLLALGCIQALRCHTGTCPAGICTQNPALYRGVVPKEKAVRVANVHRMTLDAFVSVCEAMGVSSIGAIPLDAFRRRVEAGRDLPFSRLFETIEDRALVEGGSAPEAWRRDWERARSTSFLPASPTRGIVA